ncbi:PREDICTED: protein AKNAD1 [Merops nubicus]|uniref:protein AKNAD1 n=1 Tax=Merops nubicus TaxID=57421 RepID=UPI0004F0B059|nr:PREDICTED: protein AKNAD1 [Merops nubicus]
METRERCRPSRWMKTQMNSSFPDELGCIPDGTDEEQDDLPYDGDVGITGKYNNNSSNLSDCTCTQDIFGILNLTCSEDNKNIKATANYETHLQPEEFCSYHREAIGTTRSLIELPGSEASFKKKVPVGSSSKAESKEHLTNSKMSNILLRHFSKGESIGTCQLIECETIPETSFSESIDDHVKKPEPSEHIKGPSAHEQWATNLEDHHSQKHEEVNVGDKNQNSLNGNRYASEKLISSTGECGCKKENSQLINENEDTHIFQNMKEESRLFKKTVSPCELQCGQGQAHCSLPDFSEVASEVKVPKRSDNINSVLTTEGTKPFPILLSKSLTVNNILENNYFSSAEVKNQGEMTIPELLQQLEALNQLKRHLDALERNYLRAREEHHNLQLQNHKNKSINVGEFDPERKVEGEIFRLGMLLEDIQEQTDDDSRGNASSLLTSCESAHSSYSLCESSVVSSIADPPERRGTETAFPNKNKGEKIQTTDAIPQTKGSALEGDKCNLCLHMQNSEAVKTCYSSTQDILSHQCLPSKKSAQSKSAINIRNRNVDDSPANILSSTLDHAIQTANSLKKATERMVQVVSKDLAKVKRKQL